MIYAIWIIGVLLALSVFLNWELWQRCVMYREQRNRLRRSVFIANAVSIATGALTIYSFKKAKDAKRTPID